MNFKLFLWIVVLLTFKASAHRHTAYSHDRQSQLDNRNWMRHLDPKTPLRELSLPGTHDSMALYGNDFTICQTLTLSTQLRAGIRVFDIRCRHISNVFTIHHGSYYQHASFDDAMGEMVNFLNQNSSETLLVRISEEYKPEGTSRTFEDTFLVYRSKYANYIWAPIKENPTLEEVRGKIVILQDFEGSKLYGLNYRSKQQFHIQDEYSLNHIWDLYYKWEKVKEQLISANNKVGTGFYVNYLSGVGPLFAFPYFVASGHKLRGTSQSRQTTFLTTPLWSGKFPDFPRVACIGKLCTIAFEGTNILTYQHIEKYQWIKFVGIIMIDFPGDGLINAIINLNYRKTLRKTGTDTGDTDRKRE